MKKIKLANFFIALTVVLAGIGTGIGLGIAGRTINVKATPDSEKSFYKKPSNNAPTANDKRSLKDKAKEAKRYVEIKNPKDKKFADLADLNNNSNTVVIGIPQDNHTQLSADGKTITIDYKMRVEYVYKGALQKGDLITVSLPGGMWKFDDGSTAEVRTPWLKKMQEGKAYALFLTPESRAGLFSTTGEDQGFFEIPTDKDAKTIRVSSGIAEHQIRKYQGMDVKEFLRELRKVTGKPLKNNKNS